MPLPDTKTRDFVSRMETGKISETNGCVDVKDIRSYKLINVENVQKLFNQFCACFKTKKAAEET